MRLLKNNLEQLAGESNGFNPNPINITFPQLPQDNRMRLVPKETEDEKQIMYKNGDKMRIPGVLDYTGAKYPFKKRLVKKAQEGDDLPIVDPNAKIPEYMLNNPYYSSKPPREESLIYDDDVNYYYQNIIPTRLKKSRGEDYSTDYAANIPFNNTAFFPDAYNYISDAYYSEPENYILGVTEPDLRNNDITVTLNPILTGKPITRYLGHEYAHVMQMLNNLLQNKKIIDKSSGYTPKERQILNDAYDMSGFKMSLNSNEPEVELDEGQILSEIGAMNTQVGLELTSLYKNKYNRYPSPSELDKFIDDIPKERLIDMFRESGYGEYMFGDGPITITDIQLDKVKRALKEVAMNNTNNKYYG